MRKSFFYIIILLIIFGVSVSWIKNFDRAQDKIFLKKNFQIITFTKKIENKRYREDRVIVKYKAGITALDKKSFFERTGFKKEVKLINGFYLLKRDDLSIPMKEMISKLKELPIIDYVEPDYIAYAQSITPNDPYFTYQFYLKSNGQILQIGDNKIAPKIGADIKATDAWEHSKGKEEVIIAVIDTGVDFSHPDLRNKLLEGYNFVKGDPYAIDDNGHGTAMSGIIAASTNNSLGIAGICWNCKILPIKVLDKDGVGSYSNIALGIQYAINNGAKIISMSLGGSAPSYLLESAVKEAYTKGIPVFAATGNDGTTSVLYPAAYTSYVLGVGATNYVDKKPNFSNYGPEVRVAAPGVYILTTYVGGRYAYVSGTSPATAVVAGIAGLIISKKEFLTPDELYKILEFSADDVNKAAYPGVDVFMGYGRVNAKTALAPIILN